MKKKLIKIDQYLLDKITEHTRRWIAKHAYEKHKVDLTIQVRKVKLWMLFFLCFLLPAMWFIIEGRILMAGFHLLIWSFSVGINYFSLQRLIYQQKPVHDILWASRKNPAVYEMEKAVLAHVFVALRRNRIKFIAFDFSISWFLAAFLTLLMSVASNAPLGNIVIACYFFLSPLIELVEQYLFFVFDFDEPQGKKKVKVSLTEIVKREWQRIVEGFAPQPLPHGA